MKLQLALDTVNLNEAHTLISELQGLVDIVEAGTPLILREGVQVIREIKSSHPNLSVLADFKIMDAGGFEAEIAFEAGADVVTVLGVANDITIQEAASVAKAHNRRIMVDMIAVPDLVKRTKELEQLGIDFICIHTASDLNEEDPASDLALVRDIAREISIAVAGGIDPELVRKCTPHHPDILVVGGYITRHTNPREAARDIRSCFTLSSDTTL